MSLILIERNANLNGPIIPDTLNGVLNGSEIDAHKFIVTATRDGAQIALTGTVTASFLRADGAEVVLTGEIKGGAATVTLAQSCYAVPGRFDLTIFVTADGVKTGVYACTGGVRNTTSGTIIDPGQIVPNVDDIIAKQEELAQDVADASSAIESAQNAVSYLAPVFSTSRTYAVGEYVTQEGALYICTTAVETAGAWNATNWQSVTFGGEVTGLKSALIDLSIKETIAGTGEIFVLSEAPITDVDITGSETALTVRNTQIFEPKYPGQPGTTYGVTVTKNADGSYTINGTATSSAYYFLNQSTRQGTDNLLTLSGKYSMSVSFDGGIENISATGNTLFIVGVRSSNSNQLLIGGTIDAGGEDIKRFKKEGISLDTNNGVVAIRLTNGVKYTNYTVRIMLNKGEKALDWCEYETPITISDFASDIPSVANQFLPNLWMYTDADAEIAVSQIYPPKSYIDEQVLALNDKIDALDISPTANIISANHRGYHNGYPENTLWAFAQSKLRGFDWIENDVRFTSDGVGVLLHDESINRTARNADGTEISSTINIADITYAQALQYDFGVYAGEQFAGTKIVTVEECVAFCKKVGLGILMETKVSGTGTYCANIVKKYAMEDHVIWISFGAPHLQEVCAVIPDAKIGLVTTQEPSSTHVTNAIALKTDHNTVFLDFNYNYSISSIVDSMISNGIGYGVYTLDDAAALANLNPLCFIITSNTLVANKRMASDALDEWA